MALIDLTGYRLTFDDEFNTRSISQTGQGTTWADIRSQWRYDANSDIGFGHSSFVDPASGYDPFNVQGGALAITAMPDRTKFGYPGSWESGLITTQGNFSQTYGYFEMRADLADAKGGWDAFWLLPNAPAANPNNLPGWQELDVVEHYGANNQGSYRWIHTTDPEPNKNGNLNLQVTTDNPTQVTGYHTYGMNWQKDTISFYFDGQLMGSRPTPSDMHGPMYLLANLATQTDADEAGVPMTMKIDYIRAYSSDPNAVAVTQEAVSAPDGQDPGLYGATAAGSAIPATEVQATATATPFTMNVGTGSDTLVLKLSQDAYNGDAQYTISVDGKQIGGILTAHSSHKDGVSDIITVNGDWAAGDHKVSLNFLNDAFGGTAATDRNLYLDGATYDGAAVSGGKLSLMSSGAQTVTVLDTTPVPTPATLTSPVSATTTSTTAVAVTQQTVSAPDGKDLGLYGALTAKDVPAVSDPNATAVTQQTVSAPDGKDLGLYGASTAKDVPAVSDPNATAVTQQTVSAPDGKDPGLYGARSQLPSANDSSYTTSSQSSFGIVTTDPQSVGGKVYALYDGMLGRAPDTLGLEYYADQIIHGVAPATLAANFLASPEGQARLGATDNTVFIQQLYHNTLHRNADSAGLQYHLDELAHGASRVDVAENFVFSTEHLSNLQPTLNLGLFVPDAQASEVARVYYTMLVARPMPEGWPTTSISSITAPRLPALRRSSSTRLRAKPLMASCLTAPTWTCST